MDMCHEMSHIRPMTTIAAAATMLIAISLALMIAVGWLQRRAARMRQG
jgi:ABC-type spermidine/putrescine transport system permease subunit II